MIISLSNVLWMRKINEWKTATVATTKLYKSWHVQRCHYNNERILRTWTLHSIYGNQILTKVVSASGKTLDRWNTCIYTYIYACVYMCCGWFSLRERHNKKIWYDFRPKAVYLTEDDIDMFVGCLLPSARMAIFSKVMSLDPAVSLQNLAQLRPEVVLPDLLDRYTYIHTCTYTRVLWMAVPKSEKQGKCTCRKIGHK